VRAPPPQAQLLRSCPQREPFEQGRVPAPPTFVEVRRSGTDPDELHIDAQAVLGADDVPEQPSVLIHAVGRREQAHASAGWEHPFRRRRRLRPVALRAEVHLGSVDLDEADTLPVAEGNRIAVSYVVDDVDARLLRRRRAGDESRHARAGREAEGASYAFSQAIPLSRSRPLLYDIASR
jgi:hypothetical protein